jgi:ribokinase
LGNVTIDDVVLADGVTQMGCFGGDAIYASLGARLWSAAVEFVAPIGSDYPPAQLAQLRAAGWDLRGLPTRPVPTHRNWVVYEHDGRRTWILRTSAADFFVLSPLTADVPAAFMQTRAFLLLAMDLAALEDLVPGLRGQGALLALDPQEDYIPGNEARVLELVKQVDIFLPSEIEVQRLLGHRDYPRAARQLADLGPKLVVIKLGPQGVLVYEAETDRLTRLPAYPAHVIDTTGAGDTFCGGFMARYVQTGDARQAALGGLTSASFAVEGFGLSHLFDVTPEQAAARQALLAASVKEDA